MMALAVKEPEIRVAGVSISKEVPNEDPKTSFSLGTLPTTSYSPTRPKKDRSSINMDPAPSSPRSHSRKTSKQGLTIEETIDSGLAEKSRPSTPSKLSSSSKRLGTSSPLLASLSEDNTSRASPTRNLGKLSDSDPSSPRLPGFSPGLLASISSSRTPSPRMSARNAHGDSPRQATTPRGRTHARKRSLGELQFTTEPISMKANTTGNSGEIGASVTPRNGNTLRRTASECFFASWDYGNLEADFTLPNGMHISAHYDLMQAKRAKKRRKMLKKEESKKLPGSTPFHLMTELHSKLAVDEEDEADVVYEAERRNEKEQIVIAGTSSKLFSLLADHRAQDKEYIDVYLATHLRFISTPSLINKLLQYFDDPLAHLSAKLTPEEQAEYIPLIQVRIVNIFKKWLRYHYAYEFEDVEIASKMESFIEKLAKSPQAEQKQWSAFLKSAWQRRHLTNFDSFEFDASDAPKSIVPGPSSAGDLSFLDLHPMELARQLTIKHQNMFHKVRNNHLLRFLKDNKDPGNPVGEISDFSRKVSEWVCYELASTPTVKKRAQVYANFVKLCVTLKNMSNFHGSLDIYLGLSHFLVSKLRKTIKSLDSSSKEKFKQLTELFDVTGGLKNLRKVIKNTTAPIIIPPHIWLHDLLSINELEDHVNPENGDGSAKPRSPQAEPLIDFHKLRLFANTFNEVYRCQLEPFNCSTVAVIQDYLQHHLITLPSTELETLFANVIASQEARKDSLSASPSSASSSGSSSSSSSSKPPKSPKSGLSRKASLKDLFRLKINSPNAKKEPKDF